MTPAELSRRIKEEARALGFDLVGVARAGRVDYTHTAAPAWLASGRHGTMAGWRTVREAGSTRAPRPRMPVDRGGGLVLPSPGGARAPAGGTARFDLIVGGEDYSRVLKESFTRCSLAARRRPLVRRAGVRRSARSWKGTGRRPPDSAAWQETNLAQPTSGRSCSSRALVRAELEPDEPGSITAARARAASMPARRVRSTSRTSWTPGAAIVLDDRAPGNRSMPEQEPAIGDWLFGCDVCQDVSRGTRADREPRAASRAARGGLAGDPRRAADALRAGVRGSLREHGRERARRRRVSCGTPRSWPEHRSRSDAALATAASDGDPSLSAAARRGARQRAGVSRLLVPPARPVVGDYIPGLAISTEDELRFRGVLTTAVSCGALPGDPWLASDEGRHEAFLVDAGAERIACSRSSSRRNSL